MCDPNAVLGAEETHRLLDFPQPVGLLVGDVFHFVSNAMDPVGVMARYGELLAPGSYLARSRFTSDFNSDEVAGVIEVMSRTAGPIYTRVHAAIAELFQGHDLVDPGIVRTAMWRPDAPE